MSYMIEGGGSPTLSRAKAWLYRHSEASHTLLQAITDVSVNYLEGQVLAGAQVLQVFESHAGLLNSSLFSEFCIPYLKQIVHKVKERLKKRELSREVPVVRDICIWGNRKGPCHFLMCSTCDGIYSMSLWLLLLAGTYLMEDCKPLWMQTWTSVYIKHWVVFLQAHASRLAHAQ